MKAWGIVVAVLVWGCVAHTGEALPDCAGNLGTYVTCCNIDQGGNGEVCSCVAGDRGPDCTHGAPLCMCPSGRCSDAVGQPAQCAP
jgi:hypothetical protein